MDTDKLIAQKLNAANYAELYASLSPSIFTYLKSPAPKNEEDEKKYIEKLVSKMETGDDEYYVYREPGKNSIVGFGGIKAKGTNAEMQLWVKESEWGKGFGKIITEDLIARCKIKGKRPIIACFKENLRALRLFEKLGFAKIGKQEEIINLFGSFNDNVWYFLLPNRY